MNLEELWWNDRQWIWKLLNVLFVCTQHNYLQYSINFLILFSIMFRVLHTIQHQVKIGSPLCTSWSLYIDAIIRCTIFLLQKNGKLEFISCIFWFTHSSKKNWYIVHNQSKNIKLHIVVYMGNILALTLDFNITLLFLYMIPTEIQKHPFVKWNNEAICRSPFGMCRNQMGEFIEFIKWWLSNSIPILSF